MSSYLQHLDMPVRSLVFGLLLLPLLSGRLHARTFLFSHLVEWISGLGIPAAFVWPLCGLHSLTSVIMRFALQPRASVSIAGLHSLTSVIMRFAGLHSLTSCHNAIPWIELRFTVRDASLSEP